MKTITDSGASAAQVVFTAPVAGYYWIATDFSVGTISGSVPKYLEIHVTATGVYGLASGNPSIGPGILGNMASGFESGGPDASSPYSGVHRLAQGAEISVSASKTPNVENDPDWSLSISVHLLGGPDLAVE